MNKLKTRMYWGEEGDDLLFFENVGKKVNQGIENVENKIDEGLNKARKRIKEYRKSKSKNLIRDHIEQTYNMYGI